MEANSVNTFTMFSTEHLSAIGVLFLCLFILYFLNKNGFLQNKHSLLFDRLFALSLLAMEIAYHLVLVQARDWTLSESIPIHLCSISLYFSFIVLWTGTKRFHHFVFFAGIGGALQAVLTPSLEVNFPDFLFIQFFYIHIGIIVTGFYILLAKGYRPTFKGIIQTMITLNVLFPFIFAVNILVQGNYMFLREKPVNGSLLDFLGPYPWYIVSLEFVAFLLFIPQWLVFRKWNNPQK